MKERAQESPVRKVLFFITDTASKGTNILVVIPKIQLVLKYKHCQQTPVCEDLSKEGEYDWIKNTYVHFYSLAGGVHIVFSSFTATVHILMDYTVYKSLLSIYTYVLMTITSWSRNLDVGKKKRLFLSHSLPLEDFFIFAQITQNHYCFPKILGWKKIHLKSHIVQPLMFHQTFLHVDVIQCILFISLLWPANSF